MKKELNDLITWVRKKNGELKFEWNTVNIWLMLSEQGYGRTILNNKVVYFRRIGKDISPLNLKLVNIRDHFRSQLENKEFINIPDDDLYEKIISFYYQEQPIKETEGLKYLLGKNTLTPEEEHMFLMKKDYQYTQV